MSTNCVRSSCGLFGRPLTRSFISEGTRWGRCGVSNSPFTVFCSTDSAPSAFPTFHGRRHHGLQLVQVRAQLPPPQKLPGPRMHQGTHPSAPSLGALTSLPAARLQRMRRRSVVARAWPSSCCVGRHCPRPGQLARTEGHKRAQARLASRHSWRPTLLPSPCRRHLIGIREHLR